MTDSKTTGRRLPDLAGIFRAQLALAIAGRRWGIAVALTYVLTQTIALALAGIILGVSVSSGEGETVVALGTRISQMKELGSEQLLDEGIASVIFAAGALAVWGFFWPFRVWRGEVPSRRGYHWAMPVDRMTHDLLRVAGGAVSLLVLEFSVISVALVTSALAGHTTQFAELTPFFWFSAFAAPTVLYLFVSAALVRAEHPAGWVWGVLGGIFLVWTLVEVTGLGFTTAAFRPLFVGRFGLVSALVGPVWRETILGAVPTGGSWLVGWAIWAALALAAVLLAARSGRRLDAAARPTAS